MKKIALILLLCTLQLSFSQTKSINKWIKILCNTSEMVTPKTQSKGVTRALIKAFTKSPLATKKILREIDISPIEIQRILKRYSHKELATIIKKCEGLSPRATRLLLKDLARNTPNGSKVWIQALTSNPKLVKAYERMSLDFGVKYRTDIKVLKGVSLKKHPVKLYTTNRELLGMKKQGIPFVKRRFSIGGIVYEGVFPDFTDVLIFDGKLPKNLIHASDEAQMKYMTKMVRRKIAKNPEYAKKFSKKQLSAIENSYQKIPGYTWHHKEAPRGAMQLVPEGPHNSLAHDGGNTIWGGSIR